MESRVWENQVNDCPSACHFNASKLPRDDNGPSAALLRCREGNKLDNKLLYLSYRNWRHDLTGGQRVSFDSI